MGKILLYSLIVVLTACGGLVAFFLRLPTFGKAPSAENQEALQRSKQFHGGIFRNAEISALSSPDSSSWEMLKLQLSSDPQRQPAKALPSIVRPLKSQISPDSIHLTWLGHSSLLLQAAGKNILVDPVLSGWASPIKFGFGKSYDGANPFRVEDLPAIDYVLISHDHYDHLDFETVLALAPKVKSFYVPLGLGSHLESWGVEKSKITELDWWETVEVDASTKLVLTPARHFSGRGLNDRNKTLWGSFVLILAGKKIFLSGDSGYGKHFKEIGDQYGPFDLTVLECGQYFKYWPDVHMLPEETAQAHIDLRGKLLMPIHWGKFTMAFHPWVEPVERLLAEAERRGIQVLTPLIGEDLVLDAAEPSQRWWRDL